jgi:hypothetical protein
MTTDKPINASMNANHRSKPANARWIRGRKRTAERRTVFAGRLPSPGQEEVLVVDDRAHLRPAQVVESKLTRLLQEASVPVSHLQMRGLLRAR